ncbi:HD domain-containing protein [Candidatus Endomicrobiellum trichonymphae]|uniref:HD superfamily cytoplasmic hydrolase n=1 Tax=Endomicrobium trichonymphae TaxID=1408204 RepID=B1GZK3_ENDTX|nr:HD domain-containing protein [Candidatus Endomicrobium trichonymphae]BAG13685.1 HD superfamily cytoplasmic hydrolase [Candidatus Endomicrobium trichonymphae]
MITKDLILRIFSAANILRWNDHIRPFDFFELDKQAHKMIIAYIVAKFEEEDDKPVDWVKLIECGIFEFFQRIMLTDLKPEVFREIMSKKEKELNRWVIENLNNDLSVLKGEFSKRCSEYLLESDYALHEKRILSASHCLSTKWEFNIIYPWNSMIYGIEKTKNEIEESIAAFDDLSGIKKLVINKKYYGFLDLCGQLRFQQRWAQAFRIPKTTVLGHMLTVAIFAYLLSMEINASDRRKYNNFYSSLFHDLPEILTKDIIKPVKSSIVGLENIIKHYEKKQVVEKILPLIPPEWHFEMQYFIEDEFLDKIIENGKVKKVDNAADFNDNKYNAVDGTLTEMCDKLCAYIEASMALEYGIKSSTLIKSKQTLYDKYSNVRKNNLDFRRLFDHF